MVNRSAQTRDAPAFDYALCTLAAAGLDVRGPAPAPSARHFVGIGGCQTFGRFCDAPYLARLSRRLGLPALNLGFAGAGPSFFLKRPALLEAARGARFAVVEVMPARAVENSRFRLGPSHDLVVPRSAGEDAAPVPAGAALADLARTARPGEVARLAAESRQRYLEEMRALLDALPVPTILLYLSIAEPRSGRETDGLERPDVYPSWVTAGILEALRPHATALVACVSREGLGEPVGAGRGGAAAGVPDFRHGARFPSPAMHAAAADALLPAARKALSGGARRKASRAAETSTRLLRWHLLKEAVTGAGRHRPGPPRGERRKLLLHFHIFKNAGSSVDRALLQSFGERWAQCEAPPGVAAPDERAGNAFLLRFLKANPSLEAVSSHTVRRPIHVPGWDVYPIVFLRHPIDRIRSAYDFQRVPQRRAAWDGINTVKANELDFPDYVDWLLGHPRAQHATINLQARCLSVDRYAPPEAGVFPGDVKNLDETLKFVADLPVVGIVDRFEESLDRFAAWLRPHFPRLELRPFQVNVTQAPGSTLADRLARVEEMLGRERYRRLVEANALDLHLYAYAHEKMGFAPMHAVLAG